jgi:hypothetical protein
MNEGHYISADTFRGILISVENLCKKLTASQMQNTIMYCEVPIILDLYLDKYNITVFYLT